MQPTVQGDGHCASCGQALDTTTGWASCEMGENARRYCFRELCIETFFHGVRELFRDNVLAYSDSLQIHRPRRNS